MTNPGKQFPKLDLLQPDLQIISEPGGLFVKDVLRKKLLLLTPEEWVRQHVLHWLISQTRFPVGLLSIERQANGRKRTDVLGYNQMGKALLLVECKSAEVPVSEDTARQAMLYNQTLNAPFVWLTNGLTHFVFHHQPGAGKYQQLPALPVFSEMTGMTPELL